MTVLNKATSHNFCLNICDVIIGIDAQDLSIVSELLRRYHSFLTSEPPKWTIKLRSHREAPQIKKAAIAHTDRRTTFQVSFYSGYMDFVDHYAEVNVPDADQATSGLERVAAYIVMQELPRYHNALLVHGVGVVIDEQGYLFFGASGRGKSTVGRLAAGIGEVMSDELMIVRLTDDGPQMVGTPFWGTGCPTDRVASVNYRDVPLKGFYHLVHGSQFHLNTLSTGQAVMALLSSEKVATERTSSADHWLAIVDEVAQMIPVQQLEFLPTDELWSFLTITNGKERLYDYAHNST